MALPSGYTKLKYIQSSGTQYIDTGFVPNQNTRIVLDAYNDSTSSGWTYGTWASSSSNQFAGSCNAAYAVRYGTTSAKLSANVPVGKVHFDQNKNAYTVNGTSGTFTAQTFTCAYSIYLFAINASGSVSSGKFTGKVYSCQIYDNGTIVRDFIPCMNRSGEVGLYDVVDNVFYTSAGSGSFTAGPLITGPVEGTGVSLIGGVSFGINDGKCMVGGTAYALTEGKTLVGGTGYDISFGPSVVPVTITGTGNSSYCYAIINETPYATATSGIEVFPGDTITFHAYGVTNTSAGYVQIDGVEVLTATSHKEYVWTVPEECKAITINLLYGGTSFRVYGRITVTTT